MKDNVYLQNLIDESGGRVFFPDGNFEITEPLEVSDYTHIICSPRTHLRLSKNANCPIIMNRIKDGREPTLGITIDGGIWDGNNTEQVRENYKHLLYNWGQLICFSYVENLTLRNITVKDPNSFGIMLTDIKNFTIADIIFDYNNETYNMDGIHINGWAVNGHITNIKGNTNDDMIALNSDEGKAYSENCDIENITVDGLYGGDNGWTAVRLLSRTANVKNVSLKNIYGSYRVNVVSFTHWGSNPENFGHFDNIIIENIYATSCLKEGSAYGGLIWFQSNVVDVGNVIVNNYLRNDPDNTANKTVQVQFGNNVKIDRLILNNVIQKCAYERPLIVAGKNVTVNSLIIDGEKHNISEFENGFDQI